MPSKNMIPKGKRRQSVKAEYRRHRDAVREQAAGASSEASDEAAASSHNVPPSETAPPSSTQPSASEAIQDEQVFPAPEMQESEEGIRSFSADPAASGTRLDAYLSKVLPAISRSRLQTLIEAGQIKVQGAVVSASTRLKGGERIEIEGEAVLPPLHGEPEDIPLSILYEDDDLAVINKPAGMMVHAGSGSAEHNRGTLVNALLFHFQNTLSGAGGESRPGIVHRLDKDTSGVILVAKNDPAHQGLSEQFSSRSLRKSYIALVHNFVAQDEGTVDLPISRDLVRRVRMTTRRSAGRHAITHWRVLERLDTAYGRFSLVELRIETGRTHQIRVHMQAIAHPVVGDHVYGAPEILRPKPGSTATGELRLGRNFLHAAELSFLHPVSGKPMDVGAPLAPELQDFLARLRNSHQEP